MVLLPTVVLLLLVSLGGAPTICVASTDTVSASQVLDSGGRLVSNNSKFVLGFFQDPGNNRGESSDNNSVPNMWYLGIWFNAVPNRTTVWIANGANPIMDASASPELSISDDGDLVVLNRATKSITWSTQSANGTAKNNNTVAVLLNNGNLVLQDTSNISGARILWQSFDHPTDTLLPFARLGRSKVTGLNRRLVSKKSLAGPSPGSYCLEVDPGAPQLILKVCNSSITYWFSGPWNGQFFNGIPEMSGKVPNFQIGFVDDSQEEYLQFNVTNEAVVTRNIIGVTGQNMQQVWQDASQSWLTLYVNPKLQCDVYGICGPYTVCDYSLLPLCSCMKGFSVRSMEDWEQGDRTGGCVRNTPLNCTSSDTAAASASSDKFYSLTSISLPDKAQIMQAAGSSSECSQACLNNCSCTAYSYGSQGCLGWHDELLNTKLSQSNATTTVSNGGILHLRLAASEVPSTENSKKRLIIGVAIGASVAVLLVVLSFTMWRRKRKNGVQDGGGGLVAFRYKDLRSASKNFSEKLGQGGFGAVFKGQLRDSTSIAVKRLDGSFQGEKQFRAEVNSIGIIQHINLVKLIGFCCDGDSRFLVYEHMPNRSLDIHLFQSSGTFLNWATRYQIALGVARGLSYLHEGCRDCIIHCDIKPQNILLDALFRPKIADFGMAKFVGRDFSRVLTTMRGTMGYLAPEWISGTPITPKVDLYSYGMVLLELVSGRKNTDAEYTTTDGNYAVYFPMQACRKLLDGDVMSLLDQRLDSDASFKEVERVCKVACWCIQDDEADRPTMGQVVQILEGVLDREMPPFPRLLETIFGRQRSANTSFFFTEAV